MQAANSFIGAAFAFMGEMFSQKEGMRKTSRFRRWSSGVFPNAWKKMNKGKLKMTIPSRDQSVLDNTARQIPGPDPWPIFEAINRSCHKSR